MSTLIPASIRNKTTEGLDATWESRLQNLNIKKRLLIDIENIQGLSLDLFFEMMGVPLTLFNIGSLSVDARKKLLKDMHEVYKYSGTLKSIRKMAVILGATSANISAPYWRLTFGQYEALVILGAPSVIEAKYDGLHRYDSGKEHRRQAVNVLVYGVSANNSMSYYTKFFKAWDIFQPTKLYPKLSVRAN